MQRGKVAIIFYKFCKTSFTSVILWGLFVKEANTVIPRLTKIIRSGITFVSRNVISRRFL